MADASVEVTVQNNYAEIIPGRRRQLKTNGNQVAVAREVAFGADLSRHLSEAMKDAASSRRGEGKRDRRIKNKARRAEPGDVEAMK